MDVTDIEAGVDFVDVLQRAVGSCDVLLAVIGREWLTCTDRNGRRRLDDPHDFIRLEIGIALTRNVRVIPVLVEGAVVPTASELPSDLEGLTRRQAVELRDARWNADVESLAGVLDRVLGPRAAGNESARNQPRHVKLWGLAAVALVAALVAVATLVPRDGSPPSTPAAQNVPSTPAAAEQRAPVQTEPAASASSGPEARTNPAPAAEQPTRTPASPASQPAPSTTTPRAKTPPTPRAPAAQEPQPAAQTTTPQTTPPPATTAPTQPAPTDPAPTQPDPAPDSPRRRAGADVVPLDSRPSATAVNGGWLGVLLEDAPVDSSGARMAGAIVLSVKPGGPVATAGLLPGDRVLEYGGTRVKDAANLAGLAGANAPRDSVLIRVRRGGTPRTLEMIVGNRATEPVTAASVVVYYAADDDQKTAEDLAAELRESIIDRRYTIRTLKTSRFINSEGEVRYSSSDFSTLAGGLARTAGSWLSRTYGRRVAVTPIVDPRVTATGVVVIIPGRTSAPAVPIADAVVTIVYPTADDPRMAEDLANFLRTLRSGWKYTVRTVRATTGPRKEGQIEYDNERMAGLAQVLARDGAAWLSRAYGRRVALQPTPSGRIGADAVLLWLPSR